MRRALLPMELACTQKSSLVENERVDSVRVSGAPVSVMKMGDLLCARDRHERGIEEEDDEEKEEKLLSLVYRSINSSNVVRAS